MAGQGEWLDRGQGMVFGEEVASPTEEIQFPPPVSVSNGAVSVKSHGFDGLSSNPWCRSAAAPDQLSEQFLGIIGDLIAHDEISSLAELISQCFDGKSSVALDPFSLEECLLFLGGPYRMVHVFYIGPSQIRISIFRVPFTF
jgi:hypothetical protein